MGRIGASRVFFDIQAIFRASQMVQDAQAQATLVQSVFLDSFDAISDSAAEMVEKIGQLGQVSFEAASNCSLITCSSLNALVVIPIALKLPPM